MSGSCTGRWCHLELEQLHKVPRDKGQGQTKRAEIQRVFHGANQKSFKVKNKAKPVTTNLKTRNSVNEEKVTEGKKLLQTYERDLHVSLKAVPLNLCRRS